MTSGEQEVEIKNRLKEFRQRQELSQEDLAEALGISRQSIISLEQGKHMPSLPLAINMCRFFDSTFEDVFQMHDEISREIDEVLGDQVGNIKIISKPKEAAPSIRRIGGLGAGPSTLLGAGPSTLLGAAPSTLLGAAPSTLLGAGKENKMNDLEPLRPFREMVSLRDAMDRLVEDSVITPKSVGMPRIDVKDKRNEVVIRAELPGISEEELDIEICDGVMTISGEKQEEKEEEKEGYYYKESHSGSFSRSFNLPAEVDEDKAEAEMDRGVLTIVLPKIKAKKAKKVSVKPKKAK